MGSHIPWCFRQRYDAVTSRTYHRAILRIKRRGHLKWRGLQLGSGFEVELRYSKSVKVTGEVIGLNEDFELNSLLARFLDLNHGLIEGSLFELQDNLFNYRRHYRQECRWKSAVLTYGFLTFIYDHPCLPDECTRSSLQMETDSRVRRCIRDNQDVFRLAYDRLMAVSQSEAATWWYIFWVSRGLIVIQTVFSDFLLLRMTSGGETTTAFLVCKSMLPISIHITRRPLPTSLCLDPFLKPSSHRGDYFIRNPIFLTSSMRAS